MTSFYYVFNIWRHTAQYISASFTLKAVFPLPNDVIRKPICMIVCATSLLLNYEATIKNFKIPYSEFLKYGSIYK